MDDIEIGLGIVIILIEDYSCTSDVIFYVLDSTSLNMLPYVNSYSFFIISSFPLPFEAAVNLRVSLFTSCVALSTSYIDTNAFGCLDGILLGLSILMYYYIVNECSCNKEFYMLFFRPNATMA